MSAAFCQWPGPDIAFVLVAVCVLCVASGICIGLRMHQQSQTTTQGGTE